MASESPPQWFRRALARALASCDGKAAELARRTGIPRSNIQGWQAGTVSPTMRTITPLLEYVDSLEPEAGAAPDYGVDEQAALAKIAKVLRDAGFDAPPAPTKPRKS